MKQFRNPTNIHPPVAGYVHQIEISGNERLLAISGQIGKKEDGTIPDDSIEQLSIALENLKRNLDAAGMEISDLVKVTFYLVGEMDAATRARVLQTWFGDYKPCMMLLFVNSLASPLFKVEIDAWASSEK
jgi:2-iminobutanoate/2-iminopropanoate deaminase